MKLCLRALVVLLIALYLPAVPPAEANTPAGTPIFFRETGHTLAYNFREFYETHGGLLVFGLPITEVFLEDGRPVQYFERARLEWHATLGRVQAGLLGRWAAGERSAEAPFQPIAAPAGDVTYVDATGHTFGGAFRDFWEQLGGLATYGYPLSEEFQEVNPQDGQVYTVQYFERARFEFHPELPWPYTVSLGHLGRQYLAAHPAPESALQPVASAAQAWDGVRATHIRIPRVGIDVAVEERGFNFGAWEVPRYTVAHYWPVAAHPGTAGNIIMAGHVGYRDTIFNHLPQVQVGDAISLTVGGAERHYSVEEVLTVLPNETWVMDPTESEMLTLITCVPIYVYSHRLIVRAVPLTG